jgi:hypothetical protein
MLERNDPSDRANRETNSVASSPDLDEMFGETNVPEQLPNLSSTNYPNSDLDNTRTSQDSELLFLSDIPVIPDSEEIRDFQTEEQTFANKISWQALIKTPIFAIQFAQYLVVCVIIIATLRGIHSVLGGSKAPKTTSMTPQLVHYR